MDFNKLAKQYKDELMYNVLPFWLKNLRILNLEVISAA